MRVFYLFLINEEIEKVTKTNPYELFHTLEVIYYRLKENVNLRFMFMTQLTKQIDEEQLDALLYQKYQGNYFYTKFRHTHRYHDVYRKENTTLKITKTYIRLETDAVEPKFFAELKKNHSFFVCDFANMDYFWLDSLVFV